MLYFVDYIIIFKYFIISCLLIFVLFLFSFFLVYQIIEYEKYSIYECGFVNKYKNKRTLHYLILLSFIFIILIILFYCDYITLLNAYADSNSNLDSLDYIDENVLSSDNHEKESSTRKPGKRNLCLNSTIIFLF